MAKVKKPAADGGELAIRLADPGMTFLHRAGLAGLWMTLRALKEESGSATLEGGSWECARDAVTFRYAGDGKAFFKVLLARSFRLDAEGRFHFPALGEPADGVEAAAILQEAVLGTFLQHGKKEIRVADPASNPKGLVNCTIDDAGILYRFRRVKSYAHQTADFDPSDPMKIAGWQYPGGAVRHSGLGGATALAEPPGRALSLLYAPIGAIYFEIRRRGVRLRPRFALVVPEIDDLERYAAARELCTLKGQGVKRLTVSGPAVAGLRVLERIEAARLVAGVASLSCRVVAFGTLPWSSQQKSRMRVMRVVAGSMSELRTFRIADAAFKTRTVTAKKGDAFLDVPMMPDLAAGNATRGRPWWEGFSEFVSDKEIREHVFRYEKEGLVSLMRNAESWPEGPEQAFVKACHEAWRRRLGRISEKAGRQAGSFKDQAAREFERLRVLFSRCKNAASLREAVVDFWARGGGGNEALQDHWRETFALFDERNWRKAKDLALLALASYRSESKPEDRGGETAVAEGA